MIEATTTNNMNARPYVIANDADNNKYATNYHQAEYFEVYSPLIQTQYSEVFWEMQDAVPLPKKIVERFANDKVMAVIGYEVDQVRILPDGSEESVPITWAYNHHYCSWLVHDSFTEELMTNYPNKSYVWEQPFQQEGKYPRNLFFSEGNGGEFRSSYHGYPNGYAQLIQSPTHFHINPMQIDTWNRTSTEGSKFAPGPLPTSSRIPPSAGYSGLIECPCSTRQAKEWGMTYRMADAAGCQKDSIETATECLQAAQSVVPSNEYHLIQDEDDDVPSHAKKCSIQPRSDGTVDVFWNHPSSVASSSSSLVAFGSTGFGLNVTMVLDETTMEMNITGPSNQWLGIGFGTSTMCLHPQADECPDGGPYAIIVEESSVVERKLDHHGPGKVLESTVTVVSDVVDSDWRTIRLTRSLQGLTPDHYTMDYHRQSQSQPLSMIAATGCSLDFAQHCGHGSLSLNFFRVNQVRSLCRLGIQGTIGGRAFSNVGRCADQPTSDLKAQGNPTCTIQTYRGGLHCCHSRQSLLDADQEIPWPDQLLEYHLKFRFYFEDYIPAASNTGQVSAAAAASHQHLQRLYWTTEAHAGEYDVPPCPANTPSSQCIHTITSRFRVRDSMAVPSDPLAKGVKLIYAGPHCHAPTCLSMELYNADTGQLLCRVEPLHNNDDDDKHDDDVYYETGFIAIPPCLWGEEEEELVNPPFLHFDTNLLSIKRNNNTLPPTGEMASWQMRGAIVYDNHHHHHVTEFPDEDVSREELETSD